MQDIALPVASDDGTLKEDSYLVRMSNLTVEAAEKLGRPMNVARDYKDMFEKAGFVDVTIHQFKWPSNIWPRDKKFKEMGRWNFANINEGLEGLTMALFTRGLGYSQAETREFCAGARKEIHDVKIHAYWPVSVPASVPFHGTSANYVCLDTYATERNPKACEHGVRSGN